MFKYGSFKLFLIKFSLGCLSLSISCVFLISLMSYDVNDPGFKTFQDNVSNDNISNLFGIFGAYLSSYSITIFGNLSIISGLYLLFEGFKLTTGIPNRHILLRFIINFISIIAISVSLVSLDLSGLQIGLLSTFISNQFQDLILIYTNNNLFIFMFEIIFFIVGLFLVLGSFRIKLRKAYKILFFLKMFRFVTYLNFFPIFKYIFKKPKNKNTSVKKSEPTFLKKSLNLINRILVKQVVVRRKQMLSQVVVLRSLRRNRMTFQKPRRIRLGIQKSRRIQLGIQKPRRIRMIAVTREVEV